MVSPMDACWPREPTARILRGLCWHGKIGQNLKLCGRKIPEFHQEFFWMSGGDETEIFTF